jgi:hypothetical protein
MLLSFLSFQLSQVFIQPVHAVFPGPAILFEPLTYLPQRSTAEAARPPLRIPAASDQARALQNLKVLRHRRRSDRKRLAEFLDGEFSAQEACQDSAPGGIRERRKRRAKLIRHVFHQMAN